MNLKAKEFYLVFDIGGTSFRVGIFDTQFNMIENKKFDSINFLNSQESSISAIQENTVTSIINEYTLHTDKGYLIKEICIGFPGPINNKGEVIQAPTLWGPFDNPFPLYKELTNRIPSTSIHIINDLTAAGWRYINTNKGNFCLITVSSGVGNKVFWNKRPLISNMGDGGELGHYYFGGEYKDFLCDCGEKGHVGAIASGRGVEKIAYDLIQKGHELHKISMYKNQEKISTYELNEGLRNSDKFCELILKKGTYPIAKSINYLHSTIGINQYVIIGGFACSVGETYINYIKEHLKNMGIFGKSDTDIDKMVSLGKDDDLNGLYGMAQYIKYLNKEVVLL